MNEWQPIETAPKDGTAITGWIPRFGFFARQDVLTIHWCGWIDGGGAWHNTASGHELSTRPEFWMPLPPPARA